ncbi:No apical meristem-associated C-terminal domain-containing protein [Plasmodiophora brassicae]
MQSEANRRDHRLEGESRRTRGTNARGTNFTDAEDVQLVRSWLNVSQDPATGTGQSKETFWERVEVHFCNNTTSGARTARSLQTKWGTVQRDVSKFVGSYASVNALDESGTNEEEQTEKALKLYQQTHPKNAQFAYLHCWRVLRTVPKWQDLRHRPESNNTPSKELRQLDSNGDIVEVDTTSSSQGRPIGVKAAKALKSLMKTITK